MSLINSYFQNPYILLFLWTSFHCLHEWKKKSLVWTPSSFSKSILFFTYKGFSVIFKTISQTLHYGYSPHRGSVTPIVQSSGTRSLSHAAKYPFKTHSTAASPPLFNIVPFLITHHLFSFFSSLQILFVYHPLSVLNLRSLYLEIYYVNTHVFYQLSHFFKALSNPTTNFILCRNWLPRLV